jgi:hypothetical protein
MANIVKVIPAPAGTTSSNVLYVPQVGGTVVDLNSTQTLANKTIANATLTTASLTSPTLIGPIITNCPVTVASLLATGANIATANTVTSAYPAFIRVVGANGTAGIQMPVAVNGMRYVIKNSETASAALKVYPQVNCQINEAGSNTALTVPANAACELIAFNSTYWYSNPKVPS